MRSGNRYGSVTSNIREASWQGVELDVSDAILATAPIPMPENPEINLTIACLKDAISLLTRRVIPGHTKSDYKRTLDWFAGGYQSNPGWSYEEVAERLGYDPSVLWRGIQSFAARNQGKALRGLFIRKSNVMDN